MADASESTTEYGKLNSKSGYGTDSGQTDNTLTNGIASSSSSGKAPDGGDSGKTTSPLQNNNKSVNADEDEENLHQQPRGVSDIRRRLSFLVEMLTILAVYLSFVLLAPFFTTKAKDMDLSHLQIGILLAFFAGISSISSILIGQFLPNIGPKFAFVAGAFLIGGCSILMAPQQDLSPGAEFFWFAFFTFLIWGVGHAAVNTSCTAMISFNFPGNEAILFGVMESFIGLGFLLSGPIGSGLYKVGGYGLPFYLFGGIIMVLVFASLFIVPSYSARTREKTSVFKLIRIPSVWTTCLALTVTFAQFGVITVGLAVQLTDQYQVKDAHTGFFWVLSGITKTISSTLIGTLTNKLVEHNSAAARLILIAGQVLGCVTLILLGPSNSMSHALVMVCIGLALEGIVKSCVIVPALIDVTVTARWCGLPDNFGTQSIIAGLFWGSFSFGTFLGPILGGGLIDVFGFSGACNIGAVVFLVMAAILITYLGWEYRCGRGRREPFQLFAISRLNETNDDIPLVAKQ